MDNFNNTDPREHDPGIPSPPVMPNLQLARAYVLPQIYTKAFSPEEALREGTLFPELVMPYVKRKHQEGLS